MYVYKTTNLVNGKMYIGKTIHNDSSYLGSGLLIEKSIRKYGKDNFVKEIIEECENEQELNEREIYWISHFNACESELYYNIGTCGEGTDNFTYNPNRELIREKIRNSIKGTKQTIETIQKRVETNTGKKRTKEQRDTISQSQLNYYKKNPNRQKGSDNGNYGKKHPGLNKGRIISEETRKKQSNTLKNKGEEYWNNFRELKKKERIKVFQYDLEGNLVKEWDSVTEAIRCVGASVSDAIYGRQKTAHGYIWKKQK